jgi:hypothetical protein
MGRLSRGVLVTIVALLACTGQALAGSLPGVASGPRPGPDALYMKPARAPQLENAGPWKAEPILISGTQAYRDGEYLYQDFLYDDHGGIGTPDSESPWGPDADLFSPPAGTFTYPTAPVYAGNAADLVEFRVKPLANATAFRVTLNTLLDPARTAFTIAIGSSDSSVPWPHGAGVSSPSKYFLTVHGNKGEWATADGGASATQPSVATDLNRRQIEVRVPHALWNPGTSVARMTIGVGLWDPAANAYLAPEPGSAGEDTPGGGPGAAIVNVGPRFDEPWPDPNDPVPPYTIGDAAAGAAIQSAWWREHGQATALTTGDLSPYHADVDFGKLAAGQTDDSEIPTTGAMDRILASHYQFGQGYKADNVCFEIGGVDLGAKCIGRMVGQLQPYAIYVPRKPQPGAGYGLTLLLHSLSANYNQYATSNNQSQIGERNAGSIVITPAGRGPDGFYAGVPEADTFEVWADVARRYRLDPDWAVVSGYSMGGFGTYRLLARWPDLFARGFSVVGAPGSVDDQLPSLRNTPLFLWNATADELVNMQTSEEAVQALTDAGLRFTEWLFLTADHLTLATNDEYTPGAEWLGSARVDRNPPHVTFVVDPTEDAPNAAAVSDHAYWVSGLSLRDAKAAHTGTFDARSEAFGVGDGKPTSVASGAGALEGGAHGPMLYYERRQDWTAAPATPAADRLDVTATNIGSATVDATRARLSCAPQLNVKSDGPLDLKIDCGKRQVKGERCAKRVAFRLPRVRGQRIVSVKATGRGKRLGRNHGRNLRRVAIERPTSRGFTVRLVMRTSGKGESSRRITVRRRVAAC